MMGKDPDEVDYDEPPPPPPQNTLEAIKRTSVCKKIMNLLSTPALETNHFNADGTDLFRSQLQIFFVLPMLIALILMLLIFLYPVFVDMPI